MYFVMSLRTGADTSETPQNSQNDAPTEHDVLAMRQAVKAGMTKEEIAWLTEVINQANLWWEQRYMWEDIFGWSRLGDPENLKWNYFDQTGVIQIGWAEDPDADTDGAHIEMYHMLHDMDYFLLRYGMTDVEPYVKDTSTLSIYYGALDVWESVAQTG